MKLFSILMFAALLSWGPFTRASSSESEYLAARDSNASFFDAAKTDDVTKLRAALKAGTQVNAQDSKGYTALIYAAYYGNSESVDYLLKNGADACKADNRGNTAMMGAIFKGNFRIAKRLLTTICSVDQANHNNQTPLMFASLFGRTEIGKELIKKGADTKKKDGMGNDAKSLAEAQGNEEMTKLLEK